MNILILNWRDIKNPKGGGAEILTHEMAKRWVKFGHKVTLFSSKFTESLENEMIDGVKVIRSGHPDARFLFSSVYFLAYRFYRKNSGKFDVVIDEVHGLPFFTPLYVKEKKVVLICEVANELWIEMFGKFFGTLGWLIEKIYLKLIYKNIPFLTISDSSKDELLKNGVKSKNITVLPMGITFPKKLKKYEKEKNLILIFVGRITKSKGIEDAIKALKEVSKEYFNVKLWIVGGGDKDYADYLKKIAKKLKVSDKIDFMGFVLEEKKFELLARAHILVAPSSKEGWGLVVQEAASQGTPSVVYNVAGLRDSVKNGKTGIVLEENNAKEMAKQVLDLLNNKNKYHSFQKNGLLWSKSLTWDKTTSKSLELLEEVKNKIE